MKNTTPYCLFGLVLLLGISSCNQVTKETNQPLMSAEIRTDTIFSNSLNENRLVSIYLPKGYVNTETYPVVYATDGQTNIDFYKDALDSLMAHEEVPKFIMVGVHSNEKMVADSDFSYRNYEYIKNWAEEANSVLNKRFSDHYTFFSKEVISYIQQNYSVSQERSDRVFYGTSNGAGFGVTLGSENPELIANYICFSMAGGSYESPQGTTANQPYYHLAYGNGEPFPLVIAIKEFDEFLTKNDFDHALSTYRGGHDREMWKEEFLKLIPQIVKE